MQEQELAHDCCTQGFGMDPHAHQKAYVATQTALMTNTYLIEELCDHPFSPLQGQRQRLGRVSNVSAVYTHAQRQIPLISSPSFQVRTQQLQVGIECLIIHKEGTLESI